MNNVRARLRMPLLALSLTTLASASVVTTTHAAVIYDSNAVSNAGGFSDPTVSSGLYGAQTFSLLPGLTTMTGFTWTGVYNTVITPTDLFTIEIYADDGGVPAISPLHTFAVGNAVNRTDLGVTIVGRPVQGYSAAVAPVTLAPGTTYWLSIFNHTGPTNDDNWLWSFQTGLGTAAYREPTGGPWLPSVALFDFQIVGEPTAAPVPEPTSLVLLGTGLLGARLARRRRK